MKKSGKKWLLCGFLVLLAIYAAVMLYHTYKPLPKGISYEGKTYTVHDQDIRFLSDLTYREKGTGKRKVEQAVYPEIYRMIDQAHQFIVADLFLFNGYHDQKMKVPPLAERLADRLIAKKEKEPGVRIIVITDPINTS